MDDLEKNLSEYFIKMGSYVNKNLEVIKFEEWAELHNNYNYVLIARTPIGNILISTVWLGYWADGLLKPFETGIFEGDDLIEADRHDTEEEAKDFHLKTIMKYISKDLIK